jgi:hypothetical protein
MLAQRFAEEITEEVDVIAEGLIHSTFLVPVRAANMPPVTPACR